MEFIITSCLTWQKVLAPVYIREAEGRGSDDLSRFWSHQTENLLMQTESQIANINSAEQKGCLAPAAPVMYVHKNRSCMSLDQ